MEEKGVCLSKHKPDTRSHFSIHPPPPTRHAFCNLALFGEDVDECATREALPDRPDGRYGKPVPWTLTAMLSLGQASQDKSKFFYITDLAQVLLREEETQYFMCIKKKKKLLSKTLYIWESMIRQSLEQLWVKVKSPCQTGGLNLQPSGHRHTVPLSLITSPAG